MDFGFEVQVWKMGIEWDKTIPRLGFHEGNMGHKMHYFEIQNGGSIEIVIQNPLRS